MSNENSNIEFNTLKTSVIIATYNGSKYILHELESIKNQTVKIDEVIISDDASTDNTCEIIKEFISQNNLSNWQVLEHLTNIGFSKNFMSALYLASGDVVFLADQDDIWANNKVEKILDIFRKDSSIKAVASEFQFIDGVGNLINAPKKIPYSKCLYNNKISYIKPESNVIRSYIRGCTMCVSKDVIQYAKDNSLENMASNALLGHDWILWMLASLLGNACILHAPLIKYRFHESNTSLTAITRKELLGSKKNRVQGIQKSIQIHSFILEHLLDYTNQNKKVFNLISKCINFEKKRLRLVEKGNIFDFLLLFLDVDKYSIYYNSFFKGIRVYIGDYLYSKKGDK